MPALSNTIHKHVTIDHDNRTVKVRVEEVVECDAELSCEGCGGLLGVITDITISHGERTFPLDRGDDMPPVKRR